MPMGIHDPAVGWGTFAAVKFMGYSIVAHRMKRAYGTSTVPAPVVGATRTVIGVLFGTVYGIISVLTGAVVGPLAIIFRPKAREARPGQHLAEEWNHRLLCARSSRDLGPGEDGWYLDMVNRLTRAVVAGRTRRMT
jgi:hypothetical protein